VTKINFLYVAFMVLQTMVFQACARPVIKGTEIPDTADNKAIISLIENYREAFEKRDADALLSLASKRYMETNATVGTQDDYDYDGLARKLHSEDFKRVLKARLVIQINKIDVQGDRAYADLRVETRYQTQPAEEDKKEPEWHMLSDFNRMTFIRENGKWKILSGM